MAHNYSLSLFLNFHSSRNAHRSLSQFIRNTNFREMRKFLRFRYDRKVLQHYVGIFFPKTYNELFAPLAESTSTAAFYAQTPYEHNLYTEKDFQFLISILCCESDTISRFVDYRSRFEYFFFCGEYEKACHILDTIEGEVGLSIWCLQARFMLYEKAQEKHPHSIPTIYRYSNQLLSETTVPCVKTIISFYKAKNSNTIGNNTFREMYKAIDSVDETWSMTPQSKKMLQDYLSITAFLNDNIATESNQDTIGCLLALTQCVGLIDKFIIVESLLVAWFSSLKNTNNYMSSQLLDCLQEFYTTCKCQVAKNILLAYGVLDASPYITGKTIFPYSLQDDIPITELCMKASEEGLDLFDLVAILSQRNTYIPANCPLGEIAQLVRSIYAANVKDSLFIKLTQDLDKLCRSFYGTALGYSLIHLVEALAGSTSAKLNICHHYDMLYRFHPCYEYCFLLMPTPRFELQNNAFSHMPVFKWHYQYRYETELKQPNFIHSKYIDPTVFDCLSIDTNDIEALQLKVNSYLNQSLLKVEEVRLLLYHAKALFSYYTNICAFTDAAKLYFKLNQFSQLLSAQINHNELSTRINTQVMRAFAHDYFFCCYIFITEIGAHMQSQYASHAKDNNRLLKCYTSILEDNQTTHPSKLPVPQSPLEKNAYLFFLRHVCSLDVLDTDTRNYINRTSRINERLQIIRKLLCTDEITCYESDCAELKSEEKTLLSMITRITLESLVDNKIDLSAISLSSADTYIVSIYQSIISTSEHDSTSAYGAFLDGFTDCKKKYAQQLDNQIGTKIRHAVLSSTLIDLVDSACELEFTQREQLIEDFRKQIAKFSDTSISSLLQVTSKKDDTAISLYVDDSRLYAVFSSMNLQSAQDLKSVYISLLNNQACESLKQTGFILCDKLRCSLEAALNRCTDAYDSASLIAQFNLGLERVKNWFNPVVLDQRTYPLVDVLNTLKSDLTILKDLSTDLSVTSPIYLNSSQISCISLIFINIASNVISHSGFRTISRSHFTVAVKQTMSHLVFKFTNKVSSTRTSQEIYNQINTIQNRLREPSNTEHIANLRSGNGYITIRDTLQKGFPNATSLNVSFSNSTREFCTCISIQLPIQSSTGGSEDENPNM